MFPPKKSIKFVSAPCGSGKTHAACSTIAANQHRTNHLYVAPSLDLLKQTHEQLARLHVQARTINSETHPNGVKGEIVKYLNAAPQIGAVLLITWNAFVGLPYFNRRSDWTIVVDEVPAVDRFYPYMVPHHSILLSRHLKLSPTEYDNLALVTAQDQRKLERLLDKPRDQVDDLFRPLLSDVLSKHHTVFVDTESWGRIVEEGEVSKEHEANKVFFLSMMRPEPLLGATLLGANVEDTLLYHWYRINGVPFEQELAISSKLRSFPAVGERLHISYFVADRPFSKYLGKNSAAGGGTIIDAMDALALKEFGDEPFLYIPNKDRRSAIDDLPNATEVSVVCQGLNSLQDYHKLYFAAALNREPKHLSMLDSLGLSREIAHRSTAQEAAYQAAMRTSLRNPEARDTVHVIVPDRASAERLGDLLGYRNITQLGDLLVPKEPPLSPTEKSRRAQLARLKKRIFRPKLIPESSINEGGMKSGIIPVDGGNDSCSVTLHKSLYAETAEEFEVAHGSIHDFIDFMRTAARAPYVKKDDLLLWNPAIFDPSRGKGYRTQDNFVQSSFLVLDFDGGTLSPEAFEAIFWHKAKRGTRHSFIICNSFSRSPEDPNRYRVIFPYQQPARSVAEHRAAYDYIVGRLEEAGHTEASAKLDPVSKSGVQSFLIPSTNRAHPDMAFFRTLGTKTVELMRYALDPMECAYAMPEEEKVVVGKMPNGGDTTYLDAEIAAAEAELRSMTSGRNHKFFMYGRLLAKAGYDESHIKTKLREIAGSESKMQKKIPGIMRSLTKYGRV